VNGADQEGSFDFSTSGTVTWSDSGMHGSGYADFSSDSNARLVTTGADFGGSANGAFTYCAFIYFNNFTAGDQFLTIQGDTNDHRIYLTIGATGLLALGRRAKSGSGGGVTIDTLSTGTWYFMAIGHDPGNDQVFLWLGTNKYTASDNGDYDFTESGTEQYLGDTAR